MLEEVAMQLVKNMLQTGHRFAIIQRRVEIDGYVYTLSIRRDEIPKPVAVDPDTDSHNKFS